MTQKGLHTWDLVLDYQRCPKCGNIIECRQGFSQDSHGNLSKTIHCERCAHQFIVQKIRKKSFGPLMGDPQPIEIDWES